MSSRTNTLDNGVFDITDIRQEDMTLLANIIDEYLGELEEVMIFPDDFLKENEKVIEESIRRCRKLVKKLRKGDRSVFKEDDDLETYEPE